MLIYICFIITCAVKPLWHVVSFHRLRTVTTCTKQTSSILPQAILLSPSHSISHLLLLLLGIWLPMPEYSHSNWQIWNNKTAAETTTTRCLCHPSLHANFDKPDTLGTANCLPQRSSRSSMVAPCRVSFFKLLVSPRPYWHQCLLILIIDLASRTPHFNPLGFTENSALYNFTQ